MQCVPERSSDFCIASNVSYFPGPTIKRLWSAWEPMRGGWSVVSVDCGGEFKSLSSPDQRDDLNPIPISQFLLGVASARDDLLVELDANAPRGHFQAREQLCHCQFRRLSPRCSVEEDVHEIILPPRHLHLQRLTGLEGN